jgi:hypothetical protein
MVMKTFVTFLAAMVGLVGGEAHSERLAPGSSLSGFQCYYIDAQALKLTPEEAWADKGFPPVFRAASQNSDRLGVASGVVYIAWPLQEQNGFLRILRFGGEIAWIRSDVIRPLYRTPGSKGGCTLAWHGDQIRFHLDPGAKAWLFADGRDIPDDKLR